VTVLRPFAAAGIAAAILASPAAGARDLAPDGALALRSTLKSTLLVSRFPHDPVAYPEPVGSDALFRLRLDAIATPSEAWTAEAAWETRLRSSAPPGAATGGFLPPDAPPPFRLRALDEPLATASGLAWRHELDRASLAWRAGPSELTVGRQAIGWGRGVLFGAVDLFAPFSPLEADRAWRRGVDAVRAEVRLGERLSADAAAALGHDADPASSIFAARLRGYAGELDGELLLGWRARDLLLGAASSAAVGDAEAHAEVALFRTRAANPAPLLGDDRLVAKAVLGAGYRFPLGSGLPVFAEYHYSGFGAARPADLPALLAQPAFAERLLRGDTQLQGRHAIALLATYELNEEASFQLLWLASPRDGSGVLSPTATLTLGDKTSLLAAAYVAHGAGPRGGVPRSDFGGTPLAVMVQVAVYD
jgi:hypothetical protein